MKLRSLFAAANIGFMLLFLVGGEARAAELKVVSALATRTVMADVGPMFERATGHKLAITFVTLGEAVKLSGAAKPSMSSSCRQCPAS